MSKFTDSLNQFYGQTHRAVAVIDAVQTNGYACHTVTGNTTILLTAASDSYSAGNNVYYDVKTRVILGKAPAVSWSDIGV